METPSHCQPCSCGLVLLACSCFFLLGFSRCLRQASKKKAKKQGGLKGEGTEGSPVKSSAKQGQGQGQGQVSGQGAGTQGVVASSGGEQAQSEVRGASGKASLVEAREGQGSAPEAAAVGEQAREGTGAGMEGLRAAAAAAATAAPGGVAAKADKKAKAKGFDTQREVPGVPAVCTQVTRDKGSQAGDASSAGTPASGADSNSDGCLSAESLDSPMSAQVHPMQQHPPLTQDPSQPATGAQARKPQQGAQQKVQPGAAASASAVSAGQGREQSGARPAAESSAVPASSAEAPLGTRVASGAPPPRDSGISEATVSGSAGRACGQH